MSFDAMDTDPRERGGMSAFPMKTMFFIRSEVVRVLFRPTGAKLPKTNSRSGHCMRERREISEILFFKGVEDAYICWKGGEICLC